MPTLRTIRKYLGDWFVAGSGLPSDSVIWARPNAPRPDKPYAVLDILTGPAQIGVSDSWEMPKKGSSGTLMKYAGLRRLTFSAQTFSDRRDYKSETYPTDVSAMNTMMNFFNATHIKSINQLLKQRQEDTVTIDTVENNTVYTVTIEEEPCEYTSDATATALEIRDGLISAINSNQYLNVTASEGDTDSELDVNWTQGKEYTITVDANMSVERTNEACSLSVINIPQSIQDLSPLRENTYEQSAQLDVIMMSSQVYTYDEGIIENVSDLEINGETITIP